MHGVVLKDCQRGVVCVDESGDGLCLKLPAYY